jgi:hypothetical protein
METGSLDRFGLTSRVSARAVTSGVAITLAVGTMLMLFAGVFGLLPTGNFDAESMRRLGAGFGVWTLVSWILAAFVGAWLAAVIGRSKERRDGLLHGVVTWALTMLAGGLLVWTRLIVALAVGLVTREMLMAMRTNGLYVGLFLAYVLTLVASLAGGAFGARVESRTVERRPLVTREPEGAEYSPTRPPTPQPT